MVHLQKLDHFPTELNSKRITVVSGFPTRTKSEIENELNGNKVQFDENKVQFVRKRKFHSM